MWTYVRDVQVRTGIPSARRAVGREKRVPILSHNMYTYMPAAAYETKKIKYIRIQNETGTYCVQRAVTRSRRRAERKNKINNIITITYVRTQVYNMEKREKRRGVARARANNGIRTAGRTRTILGIRIPVCVCVARVRERYRRARGTEWKKKIMNKRARAGRTE